MDFDAQFEAYRQRIDAFLPAAIPPAATTPSELHRAMHYSLAAGGKRIRPILVLAAADLFDQRCDPLYAAAAIELLHTYTLIHDDLPGMDDSPLRRGQPAAHIAFSEATAILAGDALLTEAFAILAHSYAGTPERAIAMVATLATAAGSRNLIGGQTLDTLSNAAITRPEELDAIHRHKTADLLCAAVHLGLRCTDCPDSAFDAAERFALHLGLAFQIIDDILDATSTPEALGKSTGTDQRHQRATYVSILGLDASQAAADHHSQQALAALQDLAPLSAFLPTLTQRLLQRVN